MQHPLPHSNGLRWDENLTLVSLLPFGLWLILDHFNIYIYRNIQIFFISQALFKETETPQIQYSFSQGISIPDEHSTNKNIS